MTAEQWLSAICCFYLDCMRSALRMQPGEFISMAETWRMFAVIESGLLDMHTADISAGDFTRSLQLLLLTQKWDRQINRRRAEAIWQSFMADDMISEFLRINKYGGRIWFGKESADSFSALLALSALVEITAVRRQSRSRVTSRIQRLCAWIKVAREAAERSGYELEQFLARLAQLPD